MAISAVRLLKMPNGRPPLLARWPEAASQTFKVGEFVYRAAGYVTVCGADPSVIGGLALEAGHNALASGTSYVDVLVITGMTMLQMCVDGTIAAADHGKTWDIEAATGVWNVDKDSTGSLPIRIQEFIDPVGTVLGRVGVTVLPSFREVA